MKNKATFASILSELLSSKYDNTPTRSEDYAKQLVNVHEEFVKRNQKLTDLLDDYIRQRKDRVKTNKSLKEFIFWFFVALLGVLTIAVVIFILHSRNRDTISSAISLISVSITYLASLIGVFEIMSKYLFPIDEEKDTINMIQAVIENDVKVEEVMSKAIDKNRSDIINQLKTLKKLLEENILNKEEYEELKKMLIERLKK